MRRTAEYAARQQGKSFGRARLRIDRNPAWGPATLDEVQKAPGLLDKIKWAYDEGALGKATFDSLPEASAGS